MFENWKNLEGHLHTILGNMNAPTLNPWLTNLIYILTLLRLSQQFPTSGITRESKIELKKEFYYDMIN